MQTVLILLFGLLLVAGMIYLIVQALIEKAERIARLDSEDTAKVPLQDPFGVHE